MSKDNFDKYLENLMKQENKKLEKQKVVKETIDLHTPKQEIHFKKDPYMENKLAGYGCLLEHDVVNKLKRLEE
jgi:hypothetical protein